MADSFTEQLRRIDDADLTPHQFRLLMHYWRVGQCWERVRTTADKCGMGKSTVDRERRWLLDNGWIEWVPVEVRGQIRMAIQLVPQGDKHNNTCPTGGQTLQLSHPGTDLSHRGTEPVVVVPQGDAILNEPQDLNEPLEEKREERPPPPTPSPADEDDDETQIAWEAAQEIMAFWCEMVGELVPTSDEKRRRMVSTHYGPITLLWQRLNGDSTETKRLLRSKYEEMLADGLRPRKPAAIIPQIFGDLTAAKLPSANGRKSGKSVKQKVEEAIKKHGMAQETG